MRMEIDGRVVHVTLSRRNLISLLSKLDWQESARTIFTVDDVPPGTSLVVTAESDDEHYKGREFPPGMVHPVTEAELARWDT